MAGATGTVFGHRRGVVVAAVLAVIVLAALIAVAAVQDPASAPGAGAGAGTTTGSTGGEGTEPGASSTAPAPVETTTTLPPGPDQITLAFAGDLLPHMPLNNRAKAYGAESGRAWDYRPMLAPMKPILEPADLAICHMEVPVHPAGEEPSSYPSFGVPEELTDAIVDAGYDGCSTASNHTLDRGQAGIAATLEAFDERGLGHTGSARTAEEAATTRVYDVQGVKVANLSYAYDFNGYQRPADRLWSANKIEIDQIKADTARARAEGADLVVLSLHFGTEYRHQPSEYQRDVIAQLLPSPDIDLVIGHHAHVVQPIERIEGTYVAWGLGNQLANQGEVPRSDGLTVVATATRGTDGRWSPSGIEAVPTFVDAGNTFRVLPIVETLASGSVEPGLRAKLEAAYGRTAEVLASVLTEGLTLAPLP